MTPQRFARLQSVLDRRQPDLAVLLDDVHKPHNVAAVVRTCDAVGVSDVHAVWHDVGMRPNREISAGAAKWVQMNVHDDVQAAIAALRADGMRIVAAHFSAQAVDFRSIDYAQPCALMLGSELRGVSDAGAGFADSHVVIPMAGMTASLNVSVAAAVILFEAQRQREAAGAYSRCRLTPERRARLLFEWGYPDVAAWCRKRERAYPPLDAEGLIVGRP